MIQDKFLIFIVEKKNNELNFFWFDLFWGQKVYGHVGAGYVFAVPAGEEFKKERVFAFEYKDNRVEIEPQFCTFYRVRGTIERTEFGWIDRHESYPYDYTVLYDETISFEENMKE